MLPWPSVPTATPPSGPLLAVPGEVVSLAPEDAHGAVIGMPCFCVQRVQPVSEGFPTSVLAATRHRMQKVRVMSVLVTALLSAACFYSHFLSFLHCLPPAGGPLGPQPPPRFPGRPFLWRSLCLHPWKPLRSSLHTGHVGAPCSPSPPTSRPAPKSQAFHAPLIPTDAETSDHCA